MRLEEKIQLSILDAAVNDLGLYKKLKKFSQVDKLLAEEALATLSRHL